MSGEIVGFLPLGRGYSHILSPTDRISNCFVTILVKSEISIEKNQSLKFSRVPVDHQACPLCLSRVSDQRRKNSDY